jgi:type IV secretion system protein VirB4
MLALKQFRSKAQGLPDLLNWAALIDDGIVLGKDGSLLAGWFFRGPDAASMTAAERNALSARVNAALKALGSEWALWFDAVRMPAAAYPDPSASHFRDPISALIDAERRAQFLAEAAHFETEHALLARYTPPLRRQTRIVDLIYDDDDDASAAILASDKQIAQFRRALGELEDGLAELLSLRRMGSFQITDDYGRPHLQDELVNYLQFSLTGELAGLNIPPCAMYLDAVIGGQELWAGDTPKIGETFIACLAIEGFPHESYSLILSALDDVPVAYRFSTRFLPLDPEQAQSALSRYRRQWSQRKRGFLSQVFRTQTGPVNDDAVRMETETENALSDASSALVSFGYYTPVIVLKGPDRGELTDQARLIARQIRALGFACRVESVNTMEAWLGTLPGHAHPNIRRPLIHSLNLADLLPLSAKWPGRAHNPCPLYPPNAPPLMHAATTGATPFRLNLHVGDVGHTLIFGPTGAGKSVLLAMIAAQFRRYQHAKITVFDKGRSLFALTTACGGRHYDLGSDEGSPGLCPLAELDTDADLAWAGEWIAVCYELQTDQHPAPRQRREIHRALTLLRQAPVAGRTLTDFLATVQDADIREALGAYTIDGSFGRMLDAREDELALSDFVTYEIDDLMSMGERIVIPVLLRLFRLFEQSLDGSPAMLLLDEAWIMLAHPVFRGKIIEWLKTLRKLNCLVVMSTQSLSDAMRSGLLDVLQESCPTKIFLPNEEAGNAGSGDVLGPRDIYKLFNLNDAEIGILQTAARKRHYYAVSPEGRRLFELGLGPIALTFTAASSRDDLAHIRMLQARHGERWPYAWLEEKGVSDAQTA